MTQAKDPRRRFGDRGEDLAADFFLARGYAIVGRNWRCRAGEIDLVAEKDGVLHFIEVKTRRTREFGYPEEAITPRKLKHLRLAIETFLQSADPQPHDFQADALAIMLVPGRPPEFHYVAGIL